jgi:hypothetical protein
VFSYHSLTKDSYRSVKCSTENELANRSELKYLILQNGIKDTAIATVNILLKINFRILRSQNIMHNKINNFLVLLVESTFF